MPASGKYWAVWRSEDAHHNTAQLTAVAVESMEHGEEELLSLAKSWMGKIPMDLDILILDEIGKNISWALTVR